MDNELFELCKEVHERTGWKTNPIDGQYFIYTSDYLLDKLPRHLDENRFQMYVGQYTSQWYAGYLNYFGGQNSADTPLKALLKLTLALHDAGELK